MIPVPRPSSRPIAALLAGAVLLSLAPVAVAAGGGTPVPTRVTTAQATENRPALSKPAPQKPAPKKPAPAAAAAPKPVVLAGHRAIYRMTLKSARNSSKIADVRGVMMFEQADACDGWTTEQRFQIHFVYVEGEETDLVTNYTTWEAKNGARYRFNVRKLVNGEIDEEVRGNARLKGRGKGGEVHYLMPEAATETLNPGTVFPTLHTVGLIERAQRDQRLFNQIVFDGADAEGATEVNAVIGRTRPVTEGPDSPLLRGRDAWPVRLAFFPLSSAAETPEYETSLHLVDNGVVAGMQIDYGDFIVDAILERIEALPRPKC